MNKFVTTLILLLFVFTAKNLISQPQVAYILPDIGAPGMNVYVEFISPYNLTGNYGNDGWYLNNPGDPVRVIPANAADASKIKVGPVVVSWNGRMISTQVFVHPDLQPNSTDALTVRPEFRVPLVVVVGGQRSNEQIFYIVRSRPYFDGAGNTGETVFGAGALGVRSPRGAMIFDSLKLGNFTYTVSTNDCDPTAPGNQGYLPFVLLSRGKVSGEANTVISVDAPGINAGPGGGGGGGRFYDGATANGDNGGNGFVGGGAGGRNNAGLPLVSNLYRNPGTGSGNGGNSLNGVPFSANSAYESSGGGTGHPFGSSGISCSNANNCNPPGEYGGGSGINQVRQGGAGGYSQEGDGFSGAGGKVHGNIMNIPLAGGSGGASGNPQGLDCYAGNGGGGGGAITLFGSEISRVKVSAKGANGFDFSGLHVNLDRTPEPFGGSGSGGAINLLSKGVVSSDVTLNADGGIRNNRWGGRGRIRTDFIYGPLNFETQQGSISAYKGVTTDTSQFVRRNFRLTGTQAMPGNNISTYFFSATFDGDWSLFRGVQFTDPPNGNWAMDMTMPANRQIMCFVAMQGVPNPNNNEYLYEPVRVMSQSSANLFILDEVPVLVADTVAENKAITCIGYERFIETVIKNDESAGKNLEFNLSNNNWIFGDNGFQIVEPTGNIVLAPGDSIILKVRYFHSGGDKTNIINRFYFNHNDTEKANPWIIEFRVGDAFQPRLEFIGLEEDFIFPDTRIGGKSTRNLNLRNIGEADLYIDQILPIAPPFFVVGTNPTLPVLLKPGQEIIVSVEFRPSAEQDYRETIQSRSVLSDTTCSAFAFQPLSGKGVFSSININVTEIDFGLIPWCDGREEIITISNPESASASFNLISVAEIVGDNPEAFLLQGPKEPYFTITAGSAANFRVSISGKNAGKGIKTAVFRVETDVPETPVIEIVLKAEIVGFDVTALPNPLNLGTVDIGFDFPISINLQNNSKLPQRILSVNTNNMGSYTFPDVVGNEISANGGNYNLNFSFNSTNQSTGSVIVIAFDEPCDDTLLIPVNVNYVIAKESAFVESQKLFADANKIDTLDFGIFSPCDDGKLKFVTYENNSQGRYVIINEKLDLGCSNFYINARGFNYPEVIEPNSQPKAAAQLFFDPTNLSAGVYYCEYIVTIFINGQQIDRTVVLKAEIIEGDYEYLPENIQLTSVVGIVRNQELIIKNNGPYDIEIIGFDYVNTPEFQVSGNLLGVVIQSGREERFSVDFQPNEVKNYNFTISVKILIGGCEKDFVFTISGEGLPSKKLFLTIPNLVVEPTLDNFKIPIIGSLENDEDTLENFSIESLKITMNRTIFYPKNLVGATLINSSLLDEDRVIEMKIENINITGKNKIIAEIEGATLLGDVDFSTIRFSDIFYTNITLVGEVSATMGTIRTEICEEGGKRLLRISNQGNSVSISPNPAREFIGISANCIEKGTYSISISDINGRNINISSFENYEGSEFEYSVSHPVNQLQSGTYLLKLQTPTEIITLPFVILK